MIWTSKRDEERVEIPDDLLAPYTATKLPEGRPTGLPSVLAPAEADEAPVIVATVPSALDGFAPFDELAARRTARPEGVPERSLRPVQERRLESRYPLTIPVAATHEGSDETITGYTVDVSRSGILLEMPEPPPEAHMDIVVGDDASCSLLWCKVRRHRQAGGGWWWHMRVVAADDAWDEVVRRASGIAAGAADTLG